MSKINKLFNALEFGNELTSAQISARYGIANPRAAVHQLRSEGFAVYLNKRTDTSGRTKNKYRLGNPRRATVAAGYRLGA